MNLLIYLADQLIRGYQFADNQFQALQNQATSRAKSRSNTNPAYCMEFSPSLGSVDQEDLVI